MLVELKRAPTGFQQKPRHSMLHGFVVYLLYIGMPVSLFKRALLYKAGAHLHAPRIRRHNKQETDMGARQVNQRYGCANAYPL